ncbi:hypothetical protein H8744_06000 [Oscillospiraceae bacterium N12]|jgi:hypothetical protein|uniref:Uncharacterized protein n=1 Tax=Jilunia laotingensis TaxID=2763675 RepID=A0A926F1A8_9BACT|nr:hypothetical protein [Jilunia laotingensis]MBC8592811.1 hypothetical protein [Jilunia laotingensis]
MIRQTLLLVIVVFMHFHANAQKNYYAEAFSKCENMLSGKSIPNFQEAVFTVENAYLDNQLDKVVFVDNINLYTQICKQIMNSGNIVYPEKDKDIAAGQCAVFLFMTDTIPIVSGNDIIGSIPFTYNFEDYAGKEEWSSMFVSTLMQTNTGNCHSLPYLYKIIMDEMGYECHLALAPNHIYIKVQNKRVGWYNIELTCRDFPTDVWYVASGYIHTDAIRNGVYMKALSDKESIALCLVDLAQGYQARFGMKDGSFILKCCDTALTHFPNYINALLLKAETITALHKQAVPDSDESQELFAQMNEIYTMIHKLGYRKMPQAMYLNWLRKMGTEDVDNRMKSIMVKKDEVQQN